MYFSFGLIFSLGIICDGVINLSVKPKDTNPVLNINVTKTLELPQADVGRVIPKNKTNKLAMAKFSRKKPATSENVPKPQTRKHGPKTISPKLVKEWASEISEALFETEAKVVRRDMLLKSFSDIKIEVRDGAATVERAAAALEELLLRRAEAARKIMTKAEELAKTYHKVRPPRDYTFFDSMDLDVIKEEEELPVKPQERMWKFPTSCRSNDKLKLEHSAHFDSKVSLEHTSVKTAQEVFICDKKVKSSVYWSEKLLPVFQENYAEDATTSFQYFCSAKGFMRHFPAALWDDMYKLKIDTEDTDVYDCRLRPWYVAAGGAPRDILIMLDATGSMTSKNENLNLIAEVFTLTLLTALTDDDQVNVLRFNNLINVTSPIACFNNKLVSANHVNSAAMMAAMKGFPAKNETKMDKVLEAAVKMLQNQNNVPGRTQSCQQAIVLLTDSLERNYTEKLREWDPEGHIRLFVMWLHEREGMRDHTRTYGGWATCTKDGSFAELVTPNDATQQVMNILQVLDRPLVRQRKDHPSVFSDVYAHAEDPRRGEFHWRQKESEEQNYRYRELRKDKPSLMSDARRQKHYMHQLNLDQSGDYYEVENIHYRLQISVAVPVFDHVTVENITTELFEEKRRKSTRTYPVNRLLGVAGVDIPLDDLKLILPYHELGAGSTIFIIDHRGSIVLHDDMKPTFDGDILKPGYRTVDMIDLEQSAVDHLPRHYPHEWLEFRNTVVRDQPKGDKIMFAKNILDGGMRALLEHREYHWRRVLDHYTVVVVQPRYSRLHAVPEATFTQKLAQDATRAFHGTDYAVNPEWLYCRHVEPYFTKREREVSHFLRRRSEEPNFPMKNLKHFFSPLPPTIFEKTYQCNEKLMARLCKEATATEQWAREHEEPGTDRDCTSGCHLGSNTAFFASESGLTRWQLYHTVGSFHPPEGDEWPGGPTETWYNRAAAAPDTLVVHAPVSPVRRFRKTEDAPLPLNNRSLWMTAARTLGKPGVGIVGVAGFHFHPKHFHDVVDTATNFACSEDNPDDCEAVCDGKNWTCVVVDDGGWIVGGGQPQDYDEELRDPVRQHLANTHPTTLALLLNASVFKLHWVHDYQAVCFPPQNETAYGAAPKLMAIIQFFPSLLYSVCNTLYLLATVTRDLMFAFISMSGQVEGDTLVELQKRRNATIRSYEREKFEQLYDRRVLINKTRCAACDRTRPVYELQRTQAALEALSRGASICEWPVVGALIPRTNLVLLAVYNPCPARGRPPPNPLINAQVEMTEEIRALNHSANRLACWRDRVPLPTRPPNTKCYPHQYADEEGYRQCGLWLPDPEEEEEEEDDYDDVIDKSLKDYYADWREVDEIYS